MYSIKLKGTWSEALCQGESREDYTAQDRLRKESSLSPTRHDSCRLFLEIAGQRQGNYVLGHKLCAIERSMIVVGYRNCFAFYSGTWTVAVGWIVVQTSLTPHLFMPKITMSKARASD
jgi:hypothetical protein